MFLGSILSFLDTEIEISIVCPLSTIFDSYHSSRLVKSILLKYFVETFSIVYSLGGKMISEIELELPVNKVHCYRSNSKVRSKLEKTSKKGRNQAKFANFIAGFNLSNLKVT